MVSVSMRPNTHSLDLIPLFSHGHHIFLSSMCTHERKQQRHQQQKLIHLFSLLYNVYVCFLFVRSLNLCIDRAQVVCLVLFDVWRKSFRIFEFIWSGKKSNQLMQMYSLSLKEEHLMPKSIRKSESKRGKIYLVVHLAHLVCMGHYQGFYDSN